MFLGLYRYRQRGVGALFRVIFYVPSAVSRDLYHINVGFRYGGRSVSELVMFGGHVEGITASELTLRNFLSKEDERYGLYRGNRVLGFAMRVTLTTAYYQGERGVKV